MPVGAPEGLEELTGIIVNGIGSTLGASLEFSAILQNIPKFDGKNIELRDYIQDLRNLDDEVSEELKPRLITAVKARLKGAARNSINGKTFQTIDELIKHLKRRFAPGKNYSYYDDKLHNLRMKQGDNVGDFYDHLQALLSSARSALQEEWGQQYKEDMVSPLNKNAIDIFIKGLPTEISRGVDLSKPKTLEEAYDEAVRLESRMESSIIPSYSYKADHREFQPRRNFGQHNGNNFNSRNFNRSFNDHSQQINYVQAENATYDGSRGRNPRYDNNRPMSSWRMENYQASKKDYEDSRLFNPNQERFNQGYRNNGFGNYQNHNNYQRNNHFFNQSNSRFQDNRNGYRNFQQNWRGEQTLNYQGARPETSPNMNQNSPPRNQTYNQSSYQERRTNESAQNTRSVLTITQRREHKLPLVEDLEKMSI